MENLITTLIEQVRERMNTVPATLYEYYNGKLDMLIEIDILINTIETSKANGFKTIDWEE